MEEKDSNQTKVENYAGAGTVEYNSLEKYSYWKWADEQKEKGDPKEAQSSDENYPEYFNPFKCDMWSLGVCLEKMIGRNKNDNPKGLIRNKNLEHIIEKLKEEDWKKRFDAFELYDYINKNHLNKFTEI